MVSWMISVWTNVGGGDLWNKNLGIRNMAK